MKNEAAKNRIKRNIKATEKLLKLIKNDVQLVGVHVASHQLRVISNSLNKFANIISREERKDEDSEKLRKRNSKRDR
jgi:hypothetical protein